MNPEPSLAPSPAEADGCAAQRGANALARLCTNVAAFLLLSIVVITCANVVGRYVFGHPIAWADEAVVFIMIWGVLAGAAAVTWSEQHIKVEVVAQMAPPWLAAPARFLADLVTAATAVAVAYGGALIVAQLYAFDQRSDALEIPVAIPQAAFPAGLALSVVFVALRVAMRARAAKRSAA